MEKNIAIKQVNNKLNLNLNLTNTNWSNINSNGIWSIEPDCDRKNQKLYLLLNNNRSKKIHVFEIPANHNIYEKLYVRNVKNVFRLIFKVSDNEFVETLRGINFKNFHKGFVDSTTHASKRENDTSELFLSTVKLTDLDSRKENFKEKNITYIPMNKKVSDKKTIQGMKIGQYVQHTFRNAFKQGLISNVEIQNLQNHRYSKEIFNSNFEVLRLKTRTVQDADGRTRYYSKELFCGNYYLTAQWIEPQWNLYLKWLKKIGYNFN